MVRAEVSTTINRPVDEVFEFVRDEKNLPKWDPDLLDVKTTSEGEFGVGRSFHLDIKPFMGATEGTGEVVGYEANKKVQFQFDLGKIRPLVSHIVEQQGSATKFTRVVEIEPKGLMKLMAPMMRKMIYKRNVGYLARVKSLLES